MFVIELIYRASLADIDASMASHVKFLNKHYAAGTFLVSGRKIPREGGIIVAVGESRQQIEAIVKEDPFVAESVVATEILEIVSHSKSSEQTFSVRFVECEKGVGFLV